MKWVRVVGVLSVFALIVSSCGVFGGGDSDTATEDPPAENGEENTTDDAGSVSIADARLTIRADADPVTVNGDELESGSFQDGAPGDVVKVEPGGNAIITAESVFEIEALRGGTVTLPELSDATLDVGLEVGHVFVRLDPDANAQLAIDAGDRQFITRSPDAEFALCQAPDGASCLAVLRGEVEWLETDVASEVYSAGQASFAARGNVPDPPRCADQLAIGEMQRSLRGEDFSGALANIVDTWEPCGDDDGLEAVGPALPSAARLEHVVAPEIVVGSPDVDEDTENLVAERTLDGSADFYIEPLTATNGEFRTWLVNTAGDDADSWRQYAPEDWVQRAPGGAATQAIYAEGTADDAVKGVTYDTATQFCAAQAKRLPTEVEWELAVRAEILEDLADEAQDWVANWEEYGPGPDDVGDRQVLRGADGILAADPYFRVFAVSEAGATAARQHARVRCAADEVAIGGQVFEAVVVKDDFNSLDWPQFTDEIFELDYHPENYHVDLTAQHAQGAVVRALAEPLDDGRIDVDVFIERNNTGSDTGGFRFGAVLGTVGDLYTFTLQPDNFAGDRFLACLIPVGPELTEELDLEATLTPESDGVYGAVGLGEGHLGENCVEAEVSQEVPVASIDSPVRLSMVLTGGSTELWVNDTLVETTDAFSSLSVYGFYSQLYHRPRSHIHFDDLLITN
ncbi:MAG: SUMF1/EgtB/PvdO family nonheme iron enzyme [Acidimicrobiales bacterium]